MQQRPLIRTVADVQLAGVLIEQRGQGVNVAIPADAKSWPTTVSESTCA